MDRLTPSQRDAVGARGNVLMVAGAGTGKTLTLVKRCVSLLEAGESLEHLLLVTFTEAAAAEMRHRIGEALRAALASASTVPLREHFERQLALMDSAHISTLHAFCLELVRRHFHDLSIDPEVTVLDETQTQPLIRGTLDALFERHCAEHAPTYPAVRDLIRNGGRGSDVGLRPLIVRIHRYTQTLPCPERWLAAQICAFEQPAPEAWWPWFAAGVQDWRAEWLPELRLSAGTPNVADCVAALEALPLEATFAQCAETLATVQRADQAAWPHGSKGKVRDPFRPFFEAADFFASLTAEDGRPLVEDWTQVRADMLMLLRLAQEFTAEFGRAKRELGGVDFADLEQFALRLLWDAAVEQPTAIARRWREELNHVFVDEVQDINAAQDAILRALSREGSTANRFLVGDVKQSIYRFRLANPRIFAGYERDWQGSGSAGKCLHVSENFRSREALLNFLNPLFAALLRPTIGSVNYDNAAWLRFGAAAERPELRAQPTDEPRVELHVLRKTSLEVTREPAPADGNQSAAPEGMDESAVEREARLVACRLRELKDAGHAVWDPTAEELRPVRWSDMAVLLRSPSGRAGGFAKAFHRVGVPLAAARDGFYSALEVSDLISLLKLLDNPLQDLPLLAVLRSPLVGLSVDELAAMRSHNVERPLWRALLRFARPEPTGSGELAGSGRAKLGAFLDQFVRWRGLARQASLSGCLETALQESHYEALLALQPRARERAANIRRLLDLIRQFDPYQRQGLHRFLRFVASQEEEELDPEPVIAPATDAVRLMSIHKSKGLEFPVVVLAGLGTPFNFRDLQGAILLDEAHGLCPKVLAPQSGMRYPSLPHWLAARHERRERLGEELRLLYVAMTRARDTLVLVGTAANEAEGDPWSAEAGRPLRDREILSARCALDWLRLWLPQVTPAHGWTTETEGRSPLLRWTLHGGDDPELGAVSSPASAAPPIASAFAALSASDIERLRERLVWQYPHVPATREAAKASVSALRQRALAVTDEEAKPLWGVGSASVFPKATRRDAKGRRALSAAEAGSAAHRFLQLVRLEATGCADELQREAERLRQAGRLGTEEFKALDFASLAAFWQSEVGQRIRARAAEVRREMPFTARLSPADLASVGVPVRAGLAADEFIVMQGIADLVVVGSAELWLLDFKTDQVPEAGLNEKVNNYRPQLELYALALSRIFSRPVSERWLHFLSLNRTVRA